MFILNKNLNKLWHLFEAQKIISKNEFLDIVKKTEKEGVHLVDAFFKYEKLDDEKLLKIFSEYYNVDWIQLSNIVIAPRVKNLIPKEISQQHGFLPFKKVKDYLCVATSAPDNKQIAEFVKKKTGLEPVMFLSSPADIQQALTKFKKEVTDDFAGLLDKSTQDALAANVPLEKMVEFIPVIKIVNTIIEKAISSEASDIHIEPAKNKIFIRFRMDGLLYKIAELPKQILPMIVARIKIISNLKIDEHMVPQDGRFQFNFDGQDNALRVSIIPTLHGPKIALRILEMKEKMLTLQKLGLNRAHYQILKKEINIPQGMILVTGPTGSGKTTTLYSLLKMLNREDVNICTIEDPIEYGLDNINQMQVKPQAGLTFAGGLRALLRQDPNIIMVGEIRDTETAEIAVNAAMTGHLVLSTLHTNNAFIAPQRLIEIGVQPYLVNTVMNIIIGQRLVRKLCRHCRIKLRQPEKMLDDYNEFLNLDAAFAKLKKADLLPPKFDKSGLELYRPKGCPKCNFTGYKGRIGIYEVLVADEGLHQIILKDATETAIKNHLYKKGTLSMAEDGILKVLNGKTTFEEILRVTKE